MKNDLLNAIQSTKNDLANTLNLFEQGNINTVPFEGSWTGGQVAEHVLKSLSGILANIKGPVKPTDRDPEENVTQLGKIFLNLNIKMQSPDSIIPSIDPKDKNHLLTSLIVTLQGIKFVAETEDITATCTAFEMPMMGPLTRLEWINFACFHTMRHTQQLKNIVNKLKN